MSDGVVSQFCFLSAFRVSFAPLRETKSSENEFRAKAQSGNRKAQKKLAHYQIRDYC